MRREDRAPAVACLDQPAVLWPVLRADCEDAQTATRRRRCCAYLPRSSDRSWLQTWTAPTGDTPSAVDREPGVNSANSDCWRNLHLRSANEERHAVFTPRAWSSTLLATQRSEGDAPSGEVSC